MLSHNMTVYKLRHSFVQRLQRQIQGLVCHSCSSPPAESSVVVPSRLLCVSREHGVSSLQQRLTSAVQGCSSKLAVLIVLAVCCFDVCSIWDQDCRVVAVPENGADVYRNIEIVVGHVHVFVPCHSGIESRWPLLGAWKGRVGWREWSLPHMGEFIENVWDCRLICVVVHEENDPLAREYHLTQSWPLIPILRNVGWFVEVVADTAVFDGWNIVLHVDEIRVANKPSDDVVWICFEPGNKSFQRRLESTGVE